MSIYDNLKPTILSLITKYLYKTSILHFFTYANNLPINYLKSYTQSVDNLYIILKYKLNYISIVSPLLSHKKINQNLFSHPRLL